MRYWVKVKLNFNPSKIYVNTRKLGDKMLIIAEKNN